MTHEMVRYLDELQMTQELEKTTETTCPAKLAVFFTLERLACRWVTRTDDRILSVMESLDVP